MPDEDLLSILYVSSATRLMTDDELESLLQVSRRHNAAYDISGLLLYGDGSFMQLLEGPAAAVSEVYERIRRDARHHMVTTLLEERGLPREFADWAMAYRRLDTPTWMHLAEGIGRGAGSVVKELLADFWKSVA